MITKNHLPQIDSLRAIAVIAVVFFHFELLSFSGGFIGVDIFYVISGYLFTSIIISNTKNKKFNLIDFYLRRVRRILPLLYIIIFAVLILGLFIFNSLHYDRLIESSFSAITFVSNNFFTSEVGYFDNNKIFKPLLHTWSLSVEIQFYLIWPLIVFYSYKIFKEKFLIPIFFIFCFSFFLSIILTPRFEGYFYNSYLRLFEFCMGSFCLYYKNNFFKKKADLIFLVGISLIIYSIFFITSDDIFPGYNALIPCIGAFLIIISSGNLKLFKKFFINNFFTYIGKISYSIYLIHWPVLVYFNYIFFEKNNIIFKIILIIVTLLFSSLTYKYIEQPFRSKKNKRFKINLFKLILLLSVIFVIISTLNLHLNKLNDYFTDNIKSKKIDNTILKSRSIFNEYNSQQSKNLKKKNYFNNKNNNNVLVMGDSHGLDLFITLDKNEYFSEFEKIFYDFRRFHCFKKKTNNDKIITFLRKIINKKNTCQIILNNFNNIDIIDYELLNETDVVIIHSSWVKDIDLDKLKRFIQKYKKIKIILINRKPAFIDIPTLYSKTIGDLNRLSFKYLNKNIYIINKNLKKEAYNNNIVYLDIFNLVCSDKECDVIYNDEILLSDEDHWSLYGWKYFGKKLEQTNLKKELLDIK